MTDCVTGGGAAVRQAGFRRTSLQTLATAAAAAWPANEQMRSRHSRGNCCHSWKHTHRLRVSAAPPGGLERTRRCGAHVASQATPDPRNCLASLRRKLSAYFTSVSPDRLSPPWLLPRWFEDDEPLYDPGTLASRVPVSLHFWDGKRDVPPAYPGGAGDSGLVNGETPNRDVVGSHSLLMMSGHCSPSFSAHIRWYGHAPSRAPAVVRTVLRVMSLHAMNLHARYAALARGQQLRPEDRRRAPQRRRPPAWGGRRPAAPVPPRPPPSAEG
jgi:hypothetical protein